MTDCESELSSSVNMEVHIDIGMEACRDRGTVAHFGRYTSDRRGSSTEELPNIVRIQKVFYKYVLVRFVIYLGHGIVRRVKLSFFSISISFWARSKAPQ